MKTKNPQTLMYKGLRIFLLASQGRFKWSSSNAFKFRYSTIFKTDSINTL